MANSFIGRTDLPPGIRNNNPGNIKIGEAWQGMTGNDGTFVIFQDVTWGTRALATDLANKIREGLNTIRLIVSKYAPPVENKTDKYIAAVSDDTGLDPDTPLVMDHNTLHGLMRAIISHENGDPDGYLITEEDIDKGISMMNSTLLQLFQAAGIAIEDTADQAGGSTFWYLAIAVVGGYLLFHGKD